MDISSPEWHQEVLQAREREINEGKAKFTAFDRAKERIRNKTISLSLIIIRT